VAEASEVVLSSLPTPQAVEEAVTGPDGLLAGLRPGAVYVDLSTIDPATSRRMHAAVASAGGRMLDCPVGRGPEEAASGRLLLMVGGEAAVLEEVRPVLATLGDPIHHCGPAGAGAAAKLVNNLVSCAINALNAEALVLAAKAGVELPVMVEIMKGTAADSRHLRITTESRVLDGVFAPRFRLVLAEKDLRLAVQMGLDLGVPTPLADAAHRLHQVARGQGLGEDDQGAVIKAIETVAGVAARRR
jgi:3-hydroxyisobutyrate dehydrogenase-like beta-hydroxyacid dehydrogenase